MEMMPPSIPLMDVSSIQRKWLNRRYANHAPSHRLDIYLPDEGQGPFPVIVSIHGGAWSMGDKADVQNQSAMQGLKQGYAVVCINYRLSSEALFPAQIQDCKAAVRFLRGNAMVFGLDPERIAAWGNSSGAHLAALLGTSGRIRRLQDPSLGNPKASCRVQAAVCQYGPLEDFLNMDAELAASGKGEPNHSSPDSPESRLLGAALPLIPEAVKAASPMTYIKPYAPPFLIQHGADDGIVPVEQSLRFAERLAAVAGAAKASVDVFPGAGHADPCFGTPQNVKRVLDFLDAHLK